MDITVFNCPFFLTLSPPETQFSRTLFPSALPSHHIECGLQLAKQIPRDRIYFKQLGLSQTSLPNFHRSFQFVELKGNVFRKMGKTNLFQIACADVRERFHYAIWLFIVVCRNMTDTGWNCGKPFPCFTTHDGKLVPSCETSFFFIVEPAQAYNHVFSNFITRFSEAF
ncbi:Protein TAPT1 [Fasciola hepatica]|uniref:Protein TAPT1 n=1 Tax=Fasciola hepatica TaxID=6192 RepID=A0A4E0R5S3_FASHE|nr:Protein TAPT1 [Fasciola hepatica]